MLDERRKTRGERTGETLQMKYERKNVIVSITKQSIIILSVAAFFSACTDYVSEMEDDFGEWKKNHSEIESDESSSSVAESVSSEKVSSSSVKSNGSSADYDCSVSDGVKVVYPAGGEKFKVGQTIDVVFGTSIEDNGYRIVFKKNAGDAGMDLRDDAFDLNGPADGKTCYSVKVKLDAEYGVEATSNGIIRVIPYNRSNKGANSKEFVVEKGQNEVASSSSVKGTSSSVVPASSSSSVKVSSSSVAVSSSSKKQESSSSVSSSSTIKLASGAVLQKDVPLYWGDYSEPYDIVTIGSQIWMAENLYSLLSPYCFEDRKESCDMYGRLYTLSLTENACPDGWRVPSASDWKTLLEVVGKNSAKKLKSEKWAGLDEFGFGVLAAGSGAITGTSKRSFDASETCFWAESQTDGDDVDVLCFYTDENEAKWQSKLKTSLFSTRCIKGEKQVASSSSFVASSYVPPSGISYGTMRDDAGIEYRTVKIGDQNWMAENMAFQNGESFCYGNETKNCTEYGRLYRWQTATEICPTGWHLPSKEEWEKLIAFVGGADSAGVRLKATDSWRSDGNGDDKYGFSAFSAGVGRFTSGAEYQSLGTSTVFWTSDAYSVGMNWFDANVTVDQYHGKEEALSVRCVEGFPPVVYGTMKDQVGIEYKTVTIDGKTWMAENLALQTSNSFCYENDSENCVKYGRLYMWDAAMKACPDGWHLPTFTEFNDLLHYVVWDVSGKVLKSESGWDGTDGVGFGALPAGYMSTPSSYYYLDTRAFFWTQTVRDDLPYCIEMITGQNKADINVQCNKEVGYSVRCVKD